MRSRRFALLAAAGLLLTGTGCINDQIDLVYLDFDSPVVQPALSLPADAESATRLSVWVSKPTVSRRDGYFDGKDNQAVEWIPDTIAGPGGVGTYVIQTTTNPYSNVITRVPNTHWHLPQVQGGVHLEVPFTEDAVLGLGGQWASNASKVQWLLEGRLSTDLPADDPRVRFSVGGFMGRHTVRAAYVRQVDRGAPLVSWHDGERSTEGFFAEFVLGPSAQSRTVAGFFALGLVHQHLLTHAIPSPDPRTATQIEDEWFSLWSVTLGLRVPVSASAELVVAPRLIIDPSVDLAEPTFFLMPHVQMNVRL